VMIVFGHGSNAGEGLIGEFRRQDRERCIVDFSRWRVKMSEKRQARVNPHADLNLSNRQCTV